MVLCVVTMSVCKGPPWDLNGSKAHIGGGGGGDLYLDAFSCLANTAAVMDEGKCMEQWRNSSGKPKYWEEDLFQCRFIHCKSHVDWPGIEPGYPR